MVNKFQMNIVHLVFIQLPLHESILLKNHIDFDSVYYKSQKKKYVNIDSAAKSGHLDVVKYLHSIGAAAKDCTTDAMDNASYNCLRLIGVQIEYILEIISQTGNKMIYVALFKEIRATIVKECTV